MREWILGHFLFDCLSHISFESDKTYERPTHTNEIKPDYTTQIALKQIRNASFEKSICNLQHSAQLRSASPFSWIALFRILMADLSAYTKI